MLVINPVLNITISIVVIDNKGEYFKDNIK